MKGFILYPSYRVIEGKPHVLLFGKLENGQSFLTLNEYRPYFYIKDSDLKKLPKDYDHEKTQNLNQNILYLIEFHGLNMLLNIQG